MGRQIGFYFVKEDEEEFLKLPYLDKVAFLKFRDLKRSRYEMYNELHLDPECEASQSQTYICFKANLEDLEYTEVVKGKRYFIDSHISPVIEFTRSGLLPEENLLGSGRLWYEHKYWAKDEDDNDILLEKSEELKQLYESLAKWIKKYGKRLPNGNYIGPHAMKLYENGAELSQ